MAISLHGGSAGQRGVGSSTGGFEIRLKGALELSEGNLEGAALLRTLKVM